MEGNLALSLQVNLQNSRWLHCSQDCIPAFSSLITADDLCAAGARRRLIAVRDAGAP